MKKIFAFVLFSTLINSINAQDINDAMRLAQTDLNGTARYKAMGGAFGAVGGDFSSLNEMFLQLLNKHLIHSGVFAFFNTQEIYT